MVAAMTDSTVQVGLSQEALQRLEALQRRDRDGLLTPEAFVEDAKADESPLHRYLEWDNGEAGHQWRLHQARLILGRLRIKNVVQRREDRDYTPRYVNVVVRTESGALRRGYVQIDRAMLDEDLMIQAVRDVVQKIEGFKSRLTAYTRARRLLVHLDRFAEEANELITKEE